MFSLFSTPSRPPEPARGEAALSRSLEQAARETGVSFEYLFQTAKRESNLDPNAKAPNSSATGLFQFIEQTWLGLVKREGASLGLSAEAAAIRTDAAGRFIVDDARAKQKILDIRKDPEVSAKLAGAFTRDNRAELKAALNREPSAAELYVAHFLGAGGARDLIVRAAADPQGQAARALPEAARANRSIFYTQEGRARTNREVLAALGAMHPDTGASVAPRAEPEREAGDGAPTRSPLAFQPAASARGPARAFHDLFRSGGDTPGGSQLRRNWDAMAQTRAAAAPQGFFPSDARVNVGAIVAEAPAPRASDAPLPPVISRAGGSRPGKPLDLMPRSHRPIAEEARP